MTSDRRRAWVALALCALAWPSPRAGAHVLDGTEGPPPSEDDDGAGAEGAGGGGDGPDLFDRLELARAAGWLLSPEPVPSDREEEAEAALERFFDSEIMEDRIEWGDVDGWYYDVRRAMSPHFHPDRGRFEEQRTAAMTDLQRVFDYFHRYAGGPEPPMDTPGATPPEHRASAGTDPTDRSETLVQEAFDWCNPLNAPVRWFGVVIRVTHDPEGVLAAAWVERSSGYSVLDQAALSAARDGSVDLPAPPSGVVGDRQAVQSDWLFELGVVYLYAGCPPACVEDPELGQLCGDDIIRRRVSLLRVVDATHHTPEERRHRRRRIPWRVRP